MSDVLQSYPSTTTRDGLGKKVHYYDGEYAGKTLLVVRVANGTNIKAGQAVSIGDDFTATVHTRGTRVDGIAMETIDTSDYPTTQDYGYISVALPGSHSVRTRAYPNDTTNKAVAIGNVDTSYNGFVMGVYKGASTSPGAIAYPGSFAVNVPNITISAFNGYMQDNDKGGTLNTIIAAGDIVRFAGDAAVNVETTLEVFGFSDANTAITSVIPGCATISSKTISAESPARFIGGDTEDVLYKVPKYLTGSNDINVHIASNVATINGENTLGTGTLFETELAVGDIVTFVSKDNSGVVDANVQVVITSIASNTSATGMVIAGSNTNTGVNNATGYSQILGYRSLKTTFVG